MPRKPIGQKMTKQMCAFPEPQMDWLREKASLTGLPIPEIIRSILREKQDEEEAKKSAG